VTLLAGWGPGARAAIERLAAQRGLEASADGPLAVAVSLGSVQEAAAGAHRVWLAGRIDGQGAAAGAAQSAAATLERDGAGGLAALRGAYVLVALDRSRGSALVAHDQLGARTVAFARRGADAFAAEHIAELLDLLPATPAPDRLSVVQWLDRRTLPLGRTLYAGVERLSAGEALELGPAGARRRVLWRPAFREPPRITPAASAEALRAAAFAAVDRAAEGLERPAVKLSGGLDSACVAAGLAARDGGPRALALARTFPGYPETDESSLIERTVAVTGAQLVALPYSDVPILGPLEGYIRRWRVPLGSPNTAIWEPFMALARERGVDGMLDGEGGDELFGTPSYLISDRIRRGRLASAWRLAGKLPGMGSDPTAEVRLRVMRAIGVSGALPRGAQRLRRRLRDPREGIGGLVQDADVPALREQADEWAWKTGDGPRWWMAAVDGLLHNADRLDAAGDMQREAVDTGVDRRHPFVHDAGLVEAVLGIPPEHQFDPQRDRPVLRDGLTGLIPEEVRTRHAKSYFTEVATRALAGQEGAEQLRRLAAPDAPIRGFARPEGLAEIASISSSRANRRHRLAGELFRVAGMDAWLRHLSGTGP
jgi:asparagine synthetase B (glutamine-hydrolysing)